MLYWTLDVKPKEFRIPVKINNRSLSWRLHLFIQCISNLIHIFQAKNSPNKKYALPNWQGQELGNVLLFLVQANYFSILFIGETSTVRFFHCVELVLFRKKKKQRKQKKITFYWYLTFHYFWRNLLGSFFKILSDMDTNFFF